MAVPMLLLMSVWVVVPLLFPKVGPMPIPMYTDGCADCSDDGCRHDGCRDGCSNNCADEHHVRPVSPDILRSIDVQPHR
eukprot:8342855-Pyramimonas_sp.AAC.1